MNHVTYPARFTAKDWAAVEELEARLMAWIRLTGWSWRICVPPAFLFDDRWTRATVRGEPDPHDPEGVGEVITPEAPCARVGFCAAVELETGRQCVAALGIASVEGERIPHDAGRPGASDFHELAARLSVLVALERAAASIGADWSKSPEAASSASGPHAFQGRGLECGICGGPVLDPAHVLPGFEPPAPPASVKPRSSAHAEEAARIAVEKLDAGYSTATADEGPSPAMLAGRRPHAARLAASTEEGRATAGRAIHAAIGDIGAVMGWDAGKKRTAAEVIHALIRQTYGHGEDVPWAEIPADVIAPWGIRLRQLHGSGTPEEIREAFNRWHGQASRSGYLKAKSRAEAAAPAV